MNNQTKRKCSECGHVIPAERIEALPECTQCVRCAAKNPVRVMFDPEEVCFKSSPSGQNGWSPKS